jgi:hypothetical protein
MHLQASSLRHVRSFGRHQLCILAASHITGSGQEHDPALQAHASFASMAPTHLPTMIFPPSPHACRAANQAVQLIVMAGQGRVDAVRHQ